MEPEAGATPTPASSAETAQPSAGGSEPHPQDQAEAQSWFDDWSEAIEERIGHLEDAIGHVIASREAGATQHARHATAEPGSAAGRAAQPGEGSEGTSDGAGLSLPDSIEPERAPKPQHWYWRRFGGQ